jgi:glucose/arabinose dehydrogenase
VLVKTDAAGKHVSTTPFITGFMDPANDSFWGRPAYALQMPDGSVLISDEQLGAIYRISYRAP